MRGPAFLTSSSVCSTLPWGNPQRITHEERIGARSSDEPLPTWVMGQNLSGLDFFWCLRPMVTTAWTWIFSLTLRATPQQEEYQTPAGRVKLRTRGGTRLWHWGYSCWDEMMWRKDRSPRVVSFISWTAKAYASMSLFFQVIWNPEHVGSAGSPRGTNESVILLIHSSLQSGRLACCKAGELFFK